MSILTRPAPDGTGQMHRPGEEVTVVGSPIKRANFDDSQLIKVRFSNGALGYLRPGEFADPAAMPGLVNL